MFEHMIIEEFTKHPDPSDTASDIEIKIILDGIQRSREFIPPIPTGKRMNPKCEEAIPYPQKYCDKDCAEEHATLSKLKGVLK